MISDWYVIERKKNVLGDWRWQSNFQNERERCLSLRVLIIRVFLFLLTTSWWKMEKRCKDYVTINIALLLNYVNQIDSMLLWVYSITDQKRVAHVVQSSASMMFFPYFDIIFDRLQNRWTTTWSVFVMCKWFFRCIKSITKILKKTQKLKG